MNKDSIIQKINQVKTDFDNIQQQKSQLQNEMVKLDQQTFRIDGMYIALTELLKEIEQEENNAEPKASTTPEVVTPLVRKAQPMQEG